MTKRKESYQNQLNGPLLYFQKGKKESDSREEKGSFKELFPFYSLYYLKVELVK